MRAAALFLALAGSCTTPAHPDDHATYWRKECDAAWDRVDMAFLVKHEKECNAHRSETGTTPDQP